VFGAGTACKTRKLKSSQGKRKTHAAVDKMREPYGSQRE
jgi:hypothetical protein